MDHVSDAKCEVCSVSDGSSRRVVVRMLIVGDLCSSVCYVVCVDCNAVAW